MLYLALFVIIEAKYLKIRRIKLSKHGKKLSFIIKFDSCIDVNKHQRKNFNFIKKNIMLYEFDTKSTVFGTVWSEFFENSRESL